MARLAYDEFLTDASFQPKRKNLWYVTFGSSLLGGEARGTGATPDVLDTVQIKSIQLPGGAHGDVEVPYINLTYNFPGKWKWDDVEMKVIDYMGKSSTKTIYDWWKASVFNPESGKQAYGNTLKQLVYITLIAPNGEELERWTLKGAYPKAVKWGDVDYASDDPLELAVTWKYDRASHEIFNTEGTTEDLIGTSPSSVTF